MLSLYCFQVVRNRTGNPITLAVLFAAVARRLGVSLEPVSMESSFPVNEI